MVLWGDAATIKKGLRAHFDAGATHVCLQPVHADGDFAARDRMLGGPGRHLNGEKTMDFGIALPTAADSWKLAQRAEELGFTHAWFYDTQMLSADCFVAMGAAAVNTRAFASAPASWCRPIASRRSPPMRWPRSTPWRPAASTSASAPASPPGAPWDSARSRSRTWRPTSRRSTASCAARRSTSRWRDKKRKIRFLNPELPLFNTQDPIALHLSAFGPRTRALTAKLKAGWIDFVGKVENGIKEVEAMREAWRKAGHAMGDLQATAFALGCVLQDGEPADSERAMAQAGPRAAVMLHRAADEALAGLAPGVAMLSKTTPELQAYIDLARGFEPKDAPYLQNHRGHLMFVKPEEKRFVSADLIRATSFTASEAEIKQRIDALRGAGYTQFTIQLVPGQEQALADWARIRKAFA